MADILIYGYIGLNRYDPENSNTGTMFSKELNKVGSNENEVKVHINTLGGSAPEGITIRNLMRQYARGRRVMNPDFKMIAVVDGFAYSAGSIIMDGGDDIVMLSGSMSMMHRAGCEMEGNCLDLRSMADYLDKVDASMAKLYAARTGKKEEDMLQLMTDTTFFTPEEALKMGFCTKIDSDTKATNFFGSPDIRTREAYSEYMSKAREQKKDKLATSNQHKLGMTEGERNRRLRELQLVQAECDIVG